MQKTELNGKYKHCHIFNQNFEICYLIKEYVLLENGMIEILTDDGWILLKGDFALSEKEKCPFCEAQGMLEEKE